MCLSKHFVSAAAFFAATALVSMLWTNSAMADKRVALVIGNSSYQTVAKLPNPAGDASAVAQMFKDAGFDLVDLQIDVSNLDYKRALRRFADAASDADIAIVFFAGHGIELRGINYMIPIDAKLADERDAPDEAISLDRIVEAIDGAKHLRLVIVDACRDNPFGVTMRRQTALRTASRGLTRVEPQTTDTLIAFAAKAGSTAEDGHGKHSPLTTALLNHLTLPGLDIRLAFGRVRDEVMKMTNNRQEPFVYGSLGGGVISLVPQPSQSSAPDPAAVKADYELVEKVGTKKAWEVFVSTYPTGFYAELAKAQLAKLNAAEQKVATLEPPAQPSPVGPTSDEARAWDKVKDSSDQAAVQAFIKRYPNSPLALAAQRRLETLLQITKENEEAVQRRAEEERRAKAAEAERLEQERWARAAEAERQRVAQLIAQQRADEERRAQAEAERQKAAQQAAEEERKAKAVEAERQKAAQLAAEKAAEEERKAKAAEAERQKPAQLAAQQAAEEERKAKAAEAERQKAAQLAAEKAAEEEREAKAAEEAERQKAVEAERQKAARLAAQQAAEEERKAKAVEAERQKAAHVAAEKAAEEERKAKAAEAERQKAAQLAAQQAAEEERKAKAAEAEREKAAQLAAKKAAEEERKAKAAEEAERQKVAQLTAQKAAEEERKAKAAEEAERQKAAQQAAEVRKAKAAEEAERQKAAQEVGTGSDKISMLETPAAEKPKPSNTSELIHSAQIELSRLGCFNGEADGMLNAATQEGINRYLSRRGRRDSQIAVTESFISELHSQQVRVCPLDCPPGQIVDGNTCVAARKGSKPAKAARQEEEIHHKPTSGHARAKQEAAQPRPHVHQEVSATPRQFHSGGGGGGGGGTTIGVGF